MNGNNGNILDREEVDELMQPVYKQLKVSPRKVKIDIGSNPGDGYMSFFTRVDVTTEDNKEINVVMKAAPRIEQLRKMIPIHDVFLREMLFYEEVVPTFKRFQTETRPVKEPFKSAAKFYHSCKDEMKEVLVMQNIKSDGFKLWDRMKYMDHQHIELVLKTYGKFHSVSYAMQQADPEGYAKLKDQIIFDIFRISNVPSTMFEILEQCAHRLKKIFADDAQAMQRLEHFNPTKVWELLIEDRGAFPIICHGDCWVNNMMFKYDDINDPSKPTDICLLDLQVMRIGPPVCDLSYFFYVSAPKVFLDNLDKYLRIYYDSLSSSLEEMKCKVPMTFEDLRQEWKKFAAYGFNFTLVVSKIMASEEDEIINFCEVLSENKYEVFNNELKHDAFIDNKLKLLSQHMFDNGFL